MKHAWYFWFTLSMPKLIFKKYETIQRFSILKGLPSYFPWCTFCTCVMKHSAQHTVASQNDIKHLQPTSEQLELATFLLTAILTCCTIHKGGVQKPPSRLTVSQRGPYYSGIKAFSNLPTYVKSHLQTKKHFKWALKEYLYANSFYSLNEFYNYNSF
jgi:hypothetical protein